MANSIQKCIFLIAIFISSTKSTKIEDSLIKIISNRFSHCSIFFLSYGHANLGVNLNILGNVESKVNLAYQNVQFGTKSVKNKTSNVKLLETYHQRSDKCKFVVIQITDMKPANFEEIYKKLTPPYLASIQKGFDFFVYITQVELVDKLLLSKFPSKTKYKIALGENENIFVIKGVCFFCNQGNPLIISYPTKISKEFDYFPDHVLNLYGKTLRISSPKIIFNIQVDPPYHGINNAKRGYFKPLWDEYFNVKFNCTYNMFESTGKNGKFGGGGTGLELSNGTWIGAVGDVIEGKADFAVSATMTTSRQMKTSATNAFYYYLKLNFVTSKGRRKFSPFALLWAFDYFMWLCIFLSTIFIIFIFKCLTSAIYHLLIGRKLGYAKRGIVYHKEWGIRQQIFFVGTSFLDQDCELPIFTPLRCLVALWLFYVMIITTVYRSKMVSLLAFPFLEEIPQTFAELVNSDFKIGFLKHGDTAYNTFKASTNPVYKNLINRAEILTGAGLDCIKKTLTTRYACISYNLAATFIKASNLSDSEKRDLVISPETTYNIFSPLIMEGGSIYMEGFDGALRLIMPFHLSDYWKERDLYYTVRLPAREWFQATNQSDKLIHNDQGESEDLTLKHISGIFYILCFCLIASFIAFCVELIFNRIKTQPVLIGKWQEKFPISKVRELEQE